MLPKFNVGDRVHILPDSETVYSVVSVNEGRFQFLYDVKNTMNDEKVLNLEELNLEPVG